MSDESSNNDWIVFGIIAFFLLVYNWNKPDWTVPAKMGSLVTWTAFFSVGVLFVWMSRYYQPQFVADGVNGSIGEGCIKPAGKYYVINLGYCLYPVPMRGKLATVVIPKDELKKSGSNYVSRVMVRKTPFLSIPGAARRFIQRNSDKFNDKKIYYGHVSREFVFKNETVEPLLEIIEDLNTQINKRGLIIEGNNETLQEEIRKARELSDTEGFLKQTWNKIMKRTKDDDDD